MGMALSLGTASSQSADTIDLGPGSYVFWISNYDGGTDRFEEKLVYGTEELGIYQNLYEGVEVSPSEHFALFSGIYFVTCDSEMPTPAEREAIANLRPFAAGKTATIATEGGAEMVVGEATNVFLMGRDWPAHRIELSYPDEDGETSNETITVLDDLPLTVRINWDDGTKDTAMLVTRSKENSEFVPDPGLIGNCASLLRDPEE